MKQSTKRLFSMALSLTFIVGAFVCFFNFVQPAYKDFLQTRGEELAKEKFVESQQAIITAVKKQIDALNAQGQLQENVARTLPTEPDVSGALTQLNGIAEVNQLTPRAYNVQVTMPPTNAPRSKESSSTTPYAKPIGTVLLRGQVIGSYENMKNFLGNLETNIRLFDVREVSVQPAVDSSGKQVKAPSSYTFDVTVAAYFQGK